MSSSSSTWRARPLLVALALAAGVLSAGSAAGAAPGTEPGAVAGAGGPTRGDTSVEGTLSEVHGDPIDGDHPAGERQVVRTPDGRLLPLPEDTDLTGIGRGARVRVTGRPDATGRAPDTSKAVTVSQVAAAALPVLGVHKAVVLLVNFRNDATTPVTADVARQRIFTGADSANAYWQEVSGGRLSLAGVLRPDGDVFGYFTIPDTNLSCSPSDVDRWDADSEAAARAAGIDLSGYDHVVHVFNDTRLCGFSGRAYMPGKTVDLMSKYIGYTTVAVHELGHNLGFDHASSYSCFDAFGQPVSLAATGCTRSEYGDTFDAMGSNWSAAPHYSNPHAVAGGFLDPASVQDVTASGTYVLESTAQATGVRALRIQHGPTDGSTSDAYYLEYRRPSGQYDAFLGTGQVTRGLTLRLAAPPGTIRQTWLLDATPTTATFSDPALLAGTTYTDTLGRVTIRTVSITDTEATVQVTMASAPALVPWADVMAPGVAGKVSGSGFTAGEHVTLKWDCATSACTSVTTLASPTASSLGRFDGTAFTVPAGAPLGTTVSIGAVGDRGHFATFGLPLRTTLQASAPTATRGGALSVSGRGFVAGERVTVAFGCTAGNCSAAPVMATATADAQGSFTVSAPVPVGVRAGRYPLAATGQTSGRSATTQLTVLAAVAANPNRGVRGTTTTLTGTGFTPAETVTISVACTTATCAGASLVPLATATAAADGTVTTAVPMPVTANPGEWTLYADGGTSGVRATTTFTVTSSLAVSPTSSGRGQPVTVSGTGYRAGEAVTVLWDCGASCPGAVLGSTVADANGAIKTTVTVPATATFASHGLAAYGATSHAGAFTTFSVRSTLTVAPNNGPRGTSATVSGTGFDAGETVAVKWDCPSASCTGAVLASPVAGATGAFTTPIRIPVDATNGTSHYVGALGASSHAYTSTSYGVHVTVALSTATAPRGAVVTVQGVGFTPGSTVAVKWSCSSATCPSTTVLASPPVRTDGGITASITVPMSATDNTTTPVGVVGGPGEFGLANLKVRATLALSPDTGPHGSTTTVSGHGFTAGEVATVYWNCTSSPCSSSAPVLAQATTDAAGSFTVAVTVPLTALAGQATTIAARGGTSATFITALWHDVVRLALNPASGAAASTSSATATGYQPGETVTLRWDCATSSCTTPVLASGAADSVGTFTSAVSIPAAAAAGSHTVGARGTTSGWFGSTTFTVR